MRVLSCAAILLAASTLTGCAGRAQGADSPAQRALDAGRAAQYAGVAAQIGKDPRGSVTQVNRLIRTDKSNGLGYYLRASTVARQEAWRSAHYLIEQGRTARNLTGGITRWAMAGGETARG